MARPTRPSLPAVETYVYFTGWIGAVLYSCYECYRVAYQHRNEFVEFDFSPGWTILGHRKKDISNHEWRFWTVWFWPLLPWYCSHILIGRIVDAYFFDKRNYFYLIHSLAAIFWVIPVNGVLYALAQCCIMYFVSLFRKPLFCWSCSLIIFLTLNTQKLQNLQRIYLRVDNIEDFYLLLFSTALLNLRYTSAALEFSQKTDKPGKLQGLISFLAYCFYLPLYFTGPLLTYELFEAQVRKPNDWSARKMKYVLREFARIFFWILVIEFVLHFYYFSALSYELVLVQSMGRWPLVGLGYTQGQFFHMKYIAFYGIPGTIALIDGLDAPVQPKCIGRISMYTNMWKYFDRGLYSYLRRYIYIPISGSPDNIARKFLASSVCFLYVFYWHGMHDYLIMWCALNFMGVTLENAAALIVSKQPLKRWKEEYLTPAQYRRLRAAVSAFLTPVCIMSNFYFFMGNEIGAIYMDKMILHGTPQSYALLWFVMYCFCQASMDIERWEERVGWWDRGKRLKTS